MTVPSHNKTDEVSITCLDFPASETSTFWIGTEEGSIYQANRYDRASSKAGLNNEEIYKSHAGPVTGIHFHPGSGSIDFSDLFLSCSVDWTVKLWRGSGAGHRSTGGVTHGVKNSTPAGMADKESGIAPIHSFEEADDYVFDVKWHPNHPAVFGSVDGTGKFDLWNLNQDVEVSSTQINDQVWTVEVSPDKLDTQVPIASTSPSPQALNKLAWDKTPLSKKVGLGSSDGKLYIYDVAEKLVSPRDSEWLEMQKTIQGLVGMRDSGGGMGVNHVAGSGIDSRYR